jgi:maleate cis-trans isomerase
MMFGREGRIGFVLLDSDITTEPEMRRALPDTVDFHTARVIYPHGVTPDALEAAVSGLEQAIRSLLSVRPAAIVWGCTSGSFYGGKRGNEEILERMRGVAHGVPCVTASSAVNSTLRRLGARRVGVVSPYPPDINVRLRHFLEEEGYEVTGLFEIFGRVVDDYVLQCAPPDQIRRGAEAVAAGADTVLITCTGLVTLGLLDVLAGDFGIPVVSSNSAIMVESLRLLGCRTSAPGFTTLQAAIGTCTAEVARP